MVQQSISLTIGPFSTEVAQTVNGLVSTGIVREWKESFPTQQTPWGESTRYGYEIIDNVRTSVLKHLNDTMGADSYKQLIDALDKINRNDESQDYHALSIAAKVYQILKEKGELCLSDFPAEAKKLKWELIPEDVTKAAKFLEKIGLLKLCSSEQVA